MKSYLASGEQVIEIAKLLPIVLLIFTGIGCKESKDWEKEANERIKAIRMGEIVIEVQDHQGKPVAEALVYVEQQSHDFWFGTALNHHMFRDEIDPKIRREYQKIVISYFNAATHENALKWYHTERIQGKLNYEDADRMLKWCELNRIRMRGHCIFWAKEEFNMPWLKNLDRESLRRAVERRAKEVPARYKGRITEYDVNNEMIHGDFFRKRLGKDIVINMFQWAKDADPQAILYVNDYNILTGKDIAKYEEQIRSLLNQGAPLGGIGLQGHFDRSIPSPRRILQILDRLAIFGLPIKITEFDINTSNEERKAKALVDFYRACFSHPAVEGILMWGFWEGAHWRPKAAIFNKDFSPKPAAKAYWKLVYDEWWTKAQGKTDTKGKFIIRAFYGDYRIKVIFPDGKVIEKSISFPKGIREPMKVEIRGK
jgi:GH35 family endo-1,4-beta-xylanase